MAYKASSGSKVTAAAYETRIVMTTITPASGRGVAGTSIKFGFLIQYLYGGVWQNWGGATGVNASTWFSSPTGATVAPLNVPTVGAREFLLAAALVTPGTWEGGVSFAGWTSPDGVWSFAPSSAYRAVVIEAAVDTIMVIELTPSKAVYIVDEPVVVGVSLNTTTGAVANAPIRITVTGKPAQEVITNVNGEASFSTSFGMGAITITAAFDGMLDDGTPLYAPSTDEMTIMSVGGGEGIYPPPPNTAAIIVGGGILATALGYLLLRKPKVR